MRIALIENGSKLRTELEALLGDHEVTELSYPEAAMVLDGDFDAVVLSGSSLPYTNPITSQVENIRAEMRLIQETSVPLFGICYGFELIAFTLGGTLRELPEKASGMKAVRLTEDDAFTNGLPQQFEASEAHHWAIDEVPAGLMVLARSDTGPEIIRHESRPLFGCQFHPEKMASEPALQLFRNFLALAK